MSKDPAALMYIDTWLSSTAEMDADCRGWYLNLVLHQYDKGSLPNDIETLAQLASVKFSEFERFKQVYKQVLEQKFILGEDGRLRNPKADEILRGREKFKDKRSKSGSIGAVIKTANAIKGYNAKMVKRLKDDLYSMEIDEIKQSNNKQVLEQMLKLYLNGDGDEDEDVNKGESIYKDVIDFLNTKTGSKYKHSTDSTQRYIKARINEGFTIDDFKTVISKKTDDWKSDPKMSPYLRPETLFGTKFEGYLNEGGSTNGTSSSLNPIKLHPDGTVRDRQGNIVTL